jgi:hypothetical protein
LNFTSKKLADLTGADCFVLALSRMMKSQGQNGLIGQTQVHLEGVPEITALEAGAMNFGATYPLLNAKVKRNVFSLVPSWREGADSQRVVQQFVCKLPTSPNHS